jgi:two-component system, OmpR family, response regulator
MSPSCTIPIVEPHRATVARPVGRCGVTCLLTGGQGPLTQRLMVELPRFGVRPVLVSDSQIVSGLVRSWRFDAILLDAQGHGESRHVALRALAAATAAPLVLLAAELDEDGAIADLQHGATDVVPRSISAHLLAAKIKRLACLGSATAPAKPRPTEPPPGALQLGGLRLDLLEQRGSFNNVHVPLTSRQFAVLAMLVECADTIVDRLALPLQLGATGGVRSRAFDLQISRIRTALAQAGAHAVVIETVYGRGYRLALRAPTT